MDAGNQWLGGEAPDGGWYQPGGGGDGAVTGSPESALRTAKSRIIRLIGMSSGNSWFATRRYHHVAIARQPTIPSLVGVGYEGHDRRSELTCRRRSAPIPLTPRRIPLTRRPVSLFDIGTSHFF